MVKCIGEDKVLSWRCEQLQDACGNVVVLAGEHVVADLKWGSAPSAQPPI